MMILLMKKGKDVVMINYELDCADYLGLNIEVKKLLRYGFNFENVVDAETGEIMEQEIDKILMM